jgi:hypothetical protein
MKDKATEGRNDKQLYGTDTDENVAKDYMTLNQEKDRRLLTQVNDSLKDSLKGLLNPKSRKNHKILIISCKYFLHKIVIDLVFI